MKKERIYHCKNCGFSYQEKYFIQKEKITADGMSILVDVCPVCKAEKVEEDEMV